MDSKRVEKVTATVKKWAASSGFSSDADDIAQHVLLRLCDGRKTSIKNICIDYVRQQYGRTGSKPNRNASLKSANVKNFLNILDINEPKHTNTPEAALQKMHDFLEAIEDVPQINRAITILHIMWGFSIQDISVCLGISKPEVQAALDASYLLLKEVTSPNRKV